MRIFIGVSLFLIFFFSLLVPNMFSRPAVYKDAIAFSRLTKGYWQVWTIDSGGNRLKQETLSKYDKRKPVWKPGENKILFHTNDNELFLSDLRTHKEMRLLPEFGRIAAASFTPDGRGLIFTRFDENVKDTSNLWLYDFETKEKTLLTTDPGLQYDPSIFPDGSNVVYVAGQGWGMHEIWLLDLKSKDKKRLTENESYDLMPAVSPDGKQIAYASNVMGNYDVWLMDSDGNNQRKITKPLGMDASPAWSPNGKTLAIASQRAGNLQIWLVDTDGRNWKQLTFGEEEAREPAWRR